jgi:hypothetical protein
MPPFVPTRLLEWEQWQGSRVSHKLLSQEARSQGYTVLNVLPKCREVFLSLAYLLSLYGRVAHRQPPLTPEVETRLAAWRQETETLIAYLEETLGV